MNHPPAGSSFIQLPTGSAFSLCDGLLRMAHRLIIELPESELKDVRCILDTLSMRVDQLLDSAEIDHSLGLDGLSIDPELSYSPVPGAEDFGAVMVSTTVTTTTDGSTPTVSSPNPRRNTTGRVPIFPMTTPSTPAPTPAPAHTPTPAMVLSHGPFPLVRSSRENVGYPDYTYHPLFVRAGIPGTYQTPPTASGVANRNGYYVVSKGLYVGIFSASWDQVSAWVTGVPGSVFYKAKSWEEARDAYNTCLATGAVRILA